MPAQKRPLPEDHQREDDEEKLRSSSTLPEPEDHPELLSLQDGAESEAKQPLEERKDQTEDSEEEGSPSSSSQSKPEFVLVELPEIRKDVQCPICLGIIKKTRTVMECLHRFCQECIDKSMRLGNNECPACRTHCASRRSLRDDPNFDKIISSLYPDIDKFEEEELAFHEEEQTRNKQFQASIAQIFQRQSEALIKRRSSGKDTLDTSLTRPQRNTRYTYLRRRSRAVALQGSEEKDGNDNNESSNDERRSEVKQRKRRRRVGQRSSHPSSPVANSEGCIENEIEMTVENRGSPEILTWGRGGARSHTRHGNAVWSSRNPRLAKLVDYLRSLPENDDALDVHLVLTCMDKQSTPSLQQPHLCCRPSLPVKYLREYIAHQTPLKADEVELLALKEQCRSNDDKATSTPVISKRESVSPPIDPAKDDLQVLEAEETLGWIKANFSSKREHLTIVYQRKGRV